MFECVLFLVAESPAIEQAAQLWMVYPNILPSMLAESASGVADAPPVQRAPRVEYLATLSRHSAAVNVVRFSPNGAFSFSSPVRSSHAFTGELIASAGDGVYRSFTYVFSEP
jgi:hypothetical protein